jgi:cytochrome c-type biogenesis protein CcmH/NrfG
MKKKRRQSSRNFEAFRMLCMLCGCLSPSVLWAQSGAGGAGLEIRGDRAEIDVIVHDTSGNPITTPATVKLYLDGAPYDQGSTSKGRIFFILGRMGEFRVAVEASGYKTAQRDVTINMAVKSEVDITLQSETSTNFTPGPAGDPILAPKAKESLDKAIHALRDDNLDEAEKAIGQAMKLAGSNPDVLYVQGIVDLKRHDWAKAQTVLEKSSQIEPNHARTLAALGMALCNQKKYQEAVSPLEKSVQLDPNSGWETHWSLAEAYYHTEKYDEALKESQQAQTGSNGQAPQVDLLVAQSLVAVSRFEDSAQVLREIIKNHGGSPEAATARRYLDRLTADGKIKGQ